MSTLLSVIGEEAVKAFDTFAWSEGQSENNITDVLAKFDEYCEPRTQVMYERYRFNNRKQEQDESISAYVTESDCEELCSRGNHTGRDSTRPFGPWSPR